MTNKRKKRKENTYVLDVGFLSNCSYKPIFIGPLKRRETREERSEDFVVGEGE